MIKPSPKKPFKGISFYATASKERPNTFRARSRSKTSTLHQPTLSSIKKRNKDPSSSKNSLNLRSKTPITASRSSRRSKSP